jgi:hypothetical protein
MIYYGYSIGGYWCLLMTTILVVINGYCGYFINGYWWLLYYKPLIVSLLVVIVGYYML